MSLLKKLKKHTKGKTEIVRETIKDPTEQQAQQQNAAFRILTGNYILLQRIMKARDHIYIQRRNPLNGNIENMYEAKMDKLMSKVFESLSECDNFFREQLLSRPDADVTDIDILAHYFYQVIEGMEQMSVNDLEVMIKVVQTILTSGRYMHIDSEETYLENLRIVAQHGLELGQKGRKNVTLKDIHKIIKPKENGQEKINRSSSSTDQVL